MPAEGVAGVIEAEPVAEQSDNPGQVRQFGDGVSVSNDNRDRIVVETDGEIVGRSEGIGVSAAPAEDVIPIAEKQADFDDIDAEASVSFEMMTHRYIASTARERPRPNTTMYTATS